MVEDDFTCNVAFHSDDLFLFYKKNSTDSFTNSMEKDPQIQKCPLFTFLIKILNACFYVLFYNLGKEQTNIVKFILSNLLF